MNQRTITQYPKINIKEMLQVGRMLDNELHVFGEIFSIEYIESNLGREDIPFFVCPNCQRRRRVLYQVNDEWKCSKCHDLVYYSQQRSKNDWWYWFDRAAAEAKKIDTEFRMKDINDILNYQLNFPMFKPKYMKQTKYDNIRFCYDVYMYRGMIIMTEDMRKGLDRIKNS